MVFEPLVDSALIGLVGVCVGISGYALQNWLVKKRERESNEFVIKREKYEQWIKTLLEPLYTQSQELDLTIKKSSKEMREVCNLILLYGSDEVVRALCAFYKVVENPKGDIVNSYKNLILTMRKDLLKKTDLNVSDIVFMKWN